MKLVGGASGATVATSCGVDKGTEYLIPYLVPPEKEIIPGEAVYYSTTCTECPAGCGLSVKVRDGSPVKLEGIQGHPVNDGALCLRGQASLARLYHKDRLKGPLVRAGAGLQGVTWDDAAGEITDALSQSDAEGLENLYLSSRRTGASSQVIDLFCRTMNVRRLPDYEPLSYPAIRNANGILFRRPDIPFYNIAECDFLLTVGADILETFVSPVSNATGITRAKANPEFSWVHFEPHLSLTGTRADLRYSLNPGSEAALLLFLLRRLVSQDQYRRNLPSSVYGRIPRLSATDAATYIGVEEKVLEGVAGAIARARRPLLIVGGVSVGHSRGLDAAVLAGIIQWAAGMIGTTVDLSRAENFSGCGSMRDIYLLSEDMGERAPGVFFLAGADPIGLSHCRDSFGAALAKSKLKVSLSSVPNPTVSECDVVLPLSETLESWGDAEPRSGLRSIIQPATEPLYDTKTEGDILLGLMRSASSIKRRRTFQAYLMERLSGPRPRGFVEKLITDGYFEETSASERIVLNNTGASRFLDGMVWAPVLKKPLIVAAPSIRAYDGRSSAIPLMKEIPDPLTTISYGAWVSISESEAGRLGLVDGDEINASSLEYSLSMAVKTQRGLPPGVYSVYGNALRDWPLRVDPRSGEAICYIESSAISKTGASAKLPVMSGSMSQHGRGIIPTPNHRDHGGHGHGPHPNMYPEVEHGPYRWGMTIDLDKCVGCSACVAACYIENNVPIVGLEEHLKGREMSWIRVEPYYPGGNGGEGHRGAEGESPVSFIPMLCQHCTHAPCESVCPVYAAYHNPEGLNAQIYNRCVGTRYCANNCPYKVRRFNWFTHKRPEPSDRMLNPDIFVRGKGVMEKCTFCAHRIRLARDRAKDESRGIRDGDVVPACAQTCPAGAIVFGDLLDEKSKVYELAHSARAYRVFGHLGTEPGVYYLRPREKEDKA
jgi:molybdopterin-containing oxidoreductase family iron-sulfur binding subunit